MWIVVCWLKGLTGVAWADYNGVVGGGDYYLEVETDLVYVFGYGYALVGLAVSAWTRDGNKVGGDDFRIEVGWGSVGVMRQFETWLEQFQREEGNQNCDGAKQD